MAKQVFMAAYPDGRRPVEGAKKVLHGVGGKTYRFAVHEENFVMVVSHWDSGLRLTTFPNAIHRLSGKALTDRAKEVIDQLVGKFGADTVCKSIDRSMEGGS